MRLRRLSLKNWKNFRNLQEVPFQNAVFIIGANASGKSNLLDALRFLRDVALPAGPKSGSGGLQEAVNSIRGGLPRLRCLNAQKDTEVYLEAVMEADDMTSWTYGLGFKGEGQGNNRIIVTRETVIHEGVTLIDRPDDHDKADRERLVRTHLEQTNSNLTFRQLAYYFSSITYLHLVPQLLKFSDEIGGKTLQRDPFGQGFLYRIAETHERTRVARLKRIERALMTVVPQFSELRFARDPVTAQPHLEGNFKHWREKGAWQRENQFSDGTLRLIGLLWSLMEGDSLLLLEEPELSLNEAIVARLPRLIRTVLESGKNPTRQVIVTTHSIALLSDPAIGSESIIRLRPTQNGTIVMSPSHEEDVMLASGFSVGETLLPAVKPAEADQLFFSFEN